MGASVRSRRVGSWARLFFSVMVVAVFSALLLVGCGKDDDDPPNGTIVGGDESTPSDNTGTGSDGDDGEDTTRTDCDRLGLEDATGTGCDGDDGKDTTRTDCDRLRLEDATGTGCGDGDGTESEYPTLTDGEFDTLCRYYPRPKIPYVLSDIPNPVAFQSDAQITEYLERTGYDESKKTDLDRFKKLAHQPDTKKWTYFAFWYHYAIDILAIVYREDAVIVHYIAPNPANCDGCNFGIMPFLDVYFIPFTDKEIKFEKVELPPDKPFADDDDDGKTTVTKGTFTDRRDGKVYSTITLVNGNWVDEWMAENLNYVNTEMNCMGYGREVNCMGYDRAVGVCYGGREENCATYGRLYDWDDATTACPAGWHLPSDAEWERLVNIAGGRETAGTKLKATSGWLPPSGSPSLNGTDDYGFSALPGGFGYSDDSGGIFYGVRGEGVWWGRWEGGDEGFTRVQGMNGGAERVSRGEVGVGGNQKYLYSVRCMRNLLP